MVPKIELTKAVLIFSAGQHKQYYRPYEVDIDPYKLGNIMEATDGGKNVSPVTLNSVASSIISPCETPSVEVYIPGDFSNSRFAFILEFTITNPIHGNSVIDREIIRGYTDYCGVHQATSSIDPQMVFHVNNRTVFRESVETTRYGQFPTSALKSCDNLLTRIRNHPNAVSMRPEDAVAYQQSSLLRMGDMGVIDTRTSLDNMAKLSSMSDCVASQYLNTICNGYKRAASPQYNDFEDPNSSIHSLTRDHIRNHSLATSRFYNSIASGDPTKSHTFTFGEIDRVWPRDKSFWEIFMPSPNSQLASPIEHTEHWQGAITETSIAYSLTHLMPVIMTWLSLSQLEFSITNMVPGNHVEVQLMPNITSFLENLLNLEHLNEIKDVLLREVAYGLVMPKVSIFHIRANVSLLTNSLFEISINGNPAIPYSAPMWCNSYYSPVIGLDETALINLGGYTEYIAQEFVRHNSNNNPWANNGFEDPFDDMNSRVYPQQGLVTNRYGITEY